jgi:hypothetical protein
LLPFPMSFRNTSSLSSTFPTYQIADLLDDVALTQNPYGI